MLCAVIGERKPLSGKLARRLLLSVDLHGHGCAIVIDFKFNGQLGSLHDDLAELAFTICTGRAALDPILTLFEA